MPVTVLYPEARQQPDELEREVSSAPDVRSSSATRARSPSSPTPIAPRPTG